MNIYVYDFSGSYLGGRSVVLAKSEDEASKLLLEEMKSVFPDQIPTLKETFSCEIPAVVYYDDGDY